MVIKNLRQLFFEFVKIVVAKQHPTDPLSRSELVFVCYIKGYLIQSEGFVEVP
jgi:hypothetical protein